MQYRAVIVLVIALSSCTRTENAQPGLAASNLVIGLMRQQPDGAWRVYSPGEKFSLVPNGPCVVAEKPRTCMWYGFEFDFTSTLKDPILHCVARMSKPTDVVNPNRIEAPGASDTTFQIPLDGTRGHRAVPAYVYRDLDDPPGDWVAHVSCKYQDRDVLQFTFTASPEA